MPVKNKAMLITYSDSMGKNIKELQYILDKYIGDAIGGVHLLPFFSVNRRSWFCALGLHSCQSGFR